MYADVPLFVTSVSFSKEVVVYTVNSLPFHYCCYSILLKQVMFIKAKDSNCSRAGRTHPTLEFNKDPTLEQFEVSFCKSLFRLCCLMLCK